MMYDIAIEQWMDDKALYEKELLSNIRKGDFNPQILAVLHTKIDMCNQFIEFLKRMEQREIELDKQNNEIDNE